jgi:hypothetical protein
MSPNDTTYSSQISKPSADTYRAAGRDGQVTEHSTPHPVFRAAVDGLSRGGTVGVQVAEYPFSQTLTLNQNNVTIEGEARGTGTVGNFEGEGHGGTKLTATTDDPLITVSEDVPEKLYGELRDLYLYGTGSNNGAPGIFVDDCDQYQFERLFVQNHSVGIRFEGSSNAYNVVQSIFIENGDWHVVHRTSNKPQFYGSKFLNNAGDGVLVQDSAKAEFDQCDFHANAGRSLVFDGSDHAVVDQCQFDQRGDQDRGDAGVEVQNDARNITISSSQFQDWTKAGATGVILAGDTNKVVGCTFDKVQTAVEVTGVENIISDCTVTDCATAVDDRGTRTLVNGRGENAGAPPTTGQWNGHADYAYRHNADIRDTRNDAWYKATPAGDWEAVGASGARGR